MVTIPTLTSITEQQKNEINAETHFLRAYTYFALAKRYGGVPIIKEPQEYNGNIEELRVPRNTEKDTWDFVLEECDQAVSLFGDANENDVLRANKWVALALKSRAALYAASVAKFTHQPYVSFSGPAVDQKLVGIEVISADHYYDECISASQEIMNSGKVSGPFTKPFPPLLRKKRQTNYQKLFEQPFQCLDGLKEPIFMKAYAANTILAHNYDVLVQPPSDDPRPESLSRSYESDTGFCRLFRRLYG